MTNPTSVQSPVLDADAIRAAARRIGDVVARTPLQINGRLSARTGAQVYLKREDLQSVRSYKIRGAYNSIALLDEGARAAGVVAASAGNHAQGVAFACRAMGIRGRIYVPTTTPKQKRDRIRWHGGDAIELIATGPTYDAAATAALADVAATGASWIHAFDDPRTAAGQGTIAVEIVEQLGHVPDVVIVGVGGGGCLSGMTTYLRSLREDVTIIGVEPTGAPSLAAALLAGEPVTLSEINSFVDGAAVKRVGNLCFSVISALSPTVADHPDLPNDRTVAGSGPLPAGSAHVMHVDEGALCSTMLELYQDDGIIAEPAGALSVSALDEITIAPDTSVVCLLSGGNNDVSRYGEIIERSLVHRGLKHYFLVDFPQEPGALRGFLDEVLGPDDDITLFEYVKRNNREVGAALVGIELASAAGLPTLLERMKQSRLTTERLEPGSPAYRYLT
ncbi:threonine ammonia-lyase IlvA [Williamsia sp. CHRR-6]|uniref:threonine ammonia-lyase IlvA n=1 Tax=Williamsia sp. CHRR-6 TaxID=2835871 RepID=UPI001BDA21DF|nr:threonine ammonia-lyase IlvA [Williamsia sp. CHRR-6]MBT0565240.1 threonine ammonia-lyase IlvA [Williamsia sp. CHRR-6]